MTSGPASQSNLERPRYAGVHYALLQCLFWALMVIYFVFGAAYLYGIGLSSLGVGLVYAFSGGLSAVLQPLIARHADRSERPGTVKRWCCLATAPAVLILLVIWLVPLPLWLKVCLYAPAWMLVMMLTFLMSSLVMEYQHAGWPLNYGVGRAAGSLGFAVASYLLGLYVDRFGTDALLPVAFALSALLLFALLLWRPPLVLRHGAAEQKESAGFFRRYPKYLWLTVGTVLCLTPYSMVCNFLVRVVENVGGGSVELGTAVMICSLVEIPIMFVSVWLNRRLGSRFLMIVVAVGLTVKMLLIAMAGSVTGVYLAQLSQMLGYPLLMCVAVYYADALMAPADRVRGQAMAALTSTISCATGALVGGFLIDALGVSGLLYASLGLSLAGSVMMICFTERVKNPAETGAR